MYNLANLLSVTGKTDLVFDYVSLLLMSWIVVIFIFRQTSRHLVIMQPLLQLWPKCWGHGILCQIYSCVSFPDSQFDFCRWRGSTSRRTKSMTLTWMSRVLWVVMTDLLKLISTAAIGAFTPRRMSSLQLSDSRVPIMPRTVMLSGEHSIMYHTLTAVTPFEVLLRPLLCDCRLLKTFSTAVNMLPVIWYSYGWKCKVLDRVLLCWEMQCILNEGACVEVTFLISFAFVFFCM